MDPLIEGYLSYLDKVGRKSARTIVDVRCTLRRAIAGLERVRPDVDLWRLTLEDYLHWLEQERQLGRTSSCLAKYLSHVRGLLEYAWRSGRAERNVLDGFSLQHTLRRTAPKSLKLEEAERLVQATNASGPTARRDRLIVLLLYGCGLRTNELCALDVADINRERHELVVQKAKADRHARFRFPKRCTRSCSHTCWSTASAARCFGRVLGNVGSRRRMSVRSSLRRQPAQACATESPRARCATALPRT
jgi:integrase/recombinase XerC